MSRYCWHSDGCFRSRWLFKSPFREYPQAHIGNGHLNFLPSFELFLMPVISGNSPIWSLCLVIKCIFTSYRRVYWQPHPVIGHLKPPGPLTAASFPLEVDRLSEESLSVSVSGPQPVSSSMREDMATGVCCESFCASELAGGVNADGR